MQASTSLPAIRAKPPATAPAMPAPPAPSHSTSHASADSPQHAAPGRLSHASAVLASLPSKWNHFLIVLFIILPPFLCGPLWGIGPYAAV